MQAPSTQPERVTLFEDADKLHDLFTSENEDSIKMAHTLLAGTTDIFIFNKYIGIRLSGHFGAEQEEIWSFTKRSDYRLEESIQKKIVCIVGLDAMGYMPDFYLANAMDIQSMKSNKLNIKMCYDFNHKCHSLEFIFLKDDLPF